MSGLGVSMLDAVARAGREIPMPDANLPIKSVLLQRDPATRARTMIVAFPAGFERAVAGHYDAGEELLMLQGELSLAGLRLRTGDWAWLPPRMLRTEFKTVSGATALAWFSSGNDWKRDAADVTPLAARSLAVGLYATAEPVRLRRGGPDDEPGSSAVVAGGTVIDGPAEIVDLAIGSWRIISAGERGTAPGGAAFVRWSADAPEHQS